MPAFSSYTYYESSFPSECRTIVMVSSSIDMYFLRKSCGSKVWGDTARLTSSLSKIGGRWTVELWHYQVNGIGTLATYSDRCLSIADPHTSHIDLPKRFVDVTIHVNCAMVRIGLHLFQDVSTANGIVVTAIVVIQEVTGCFPLDTILRVSYWPAKIRYAHSARSSVKLEDKNSTTFLCGGVAAPALRSKPRAQIVGTEQGNESYRRKILGEKGMYTN